MKPTPRVFLTRLASCLRRTTFTLLAASLAGLASPAFAFNPDTISPSSVSLQPVSYFSAPVFADLIKMGRRWNRGTSWNDYVPLTELNQFGLPTSTSSTATFRTWFEGGNDKSWLPGRYVVVWTGVGDAKIAGTSTNVTLVSSSITANGGTRVYSVTGGNKIDVQLTGLTTDGLTSLNVWMPHPDAPQTVSLEPGERAAFEGSALHPEAIHFNPRLIRLIKERGWNSLRFMDWMDTNNNPSRDWSDRRLPSYALQTIGTITRNPETGNTPEYKVVDGQVTQEILYRDPGIAWEYAIALCNATGRNLWINVPHLSVLSLNGSDDYITNLAKIIAYGAKADGKPFDPANDNLTDRKWKPLSADLEVFVEYSNEVWNSRFAQRAWNNDFPGTTVPEQVAVHSNAAWTAFESIPALKTGALDRVVRLLGCQQVTGSNLTQSLNKLYRPVANGGLASYADAVTTATYFGNSIETYVRDALLEGDKQDNGGQKIYPDQDNSPVYPNYRYTPEAWARIDNEAYFDKAFDEWTRRILFGDSDAGNAFDTTGRLGGISLDVFAAASARGLRIVATEGGASIYTDKSDNGATEDDLLTNFVAKFPLKARMAELMKIHLELGRSRGLRSYNIFTLTGDAGKSGQWGVVDLDGKQDTSAKAIRYRAIRDWFDEFSTIRPVADNLFSAIGTAPSFTTAEDLGDVRIGDSVTKTMSATNATRVVIVGKVLVPGLAISAPVGNNVTISGRATRNGLNFVLLRAMDGDKDPAWRIFRFNVKEKPKNIYFGNLTNGSYSIIDDTTHLVSSGNGAPCLNVGTISPTLTNVLLRVSEATAVNIDAKTASADPLDNKPFNFDSIRLGRGNTAITGVLLEALSEAGAVIKQDPISLTGAVDTLATYDRDANWDNAFSIRITFYSAVTYDSDTKRYTPTPAAGGLIDDIKLNL